MANKNTLDRGGEEYRALFSNYLAKGHQGLTDAEARALSEGSATGGAVLFPTTYSNQFMTELADDEILGKVTKVYSSSGTFSVPVITPTGSGGFSVQKNPGEGGTLIDATAGSQAQVTVPTIDLPGTTASGTATSTFTLRRLGVMVKCSTELLEDTASRADASVEQFIIRQATQDIIAQLNKQILVGNMDATQNNGSGWVAGATAGTASTAGSDVVHGVYTTCRRYGRSLTPTQWGQGGTNYSGISSNNVWANIVLGHVRANLFAPQYWKRCMWVFNSQMLRHSTSTSAGSVFITGPNVQQSAAFGGSGRYVLGLPWTFCDMSIQDTGDNLLASSGGQMKDPIAVACDFSRYLLAFASNGVSITRLNETYAATNETAFIVSVRCAGALVDANAALGFQAYG
jgi:hypothetical protein